MERKYLTVVRGEVSGRLSSEKYALVSLNPVRGIDEQPSFCYHVVNKGYDHAGCAALCNTSKNNITADTVVAALRGCLAPSLVFVTADAYKYLQSVFAAPAVAHRLTKMVIPRKMVA